MTDRSTPAMVEGVRHCSNFVLFLSGDSVAGSSKDAAPPQASPTSDVAGPTAPSSAPHRSQSQVGSEGVACEPQHPGSAAAGASAGPLQAAPPPPAGPSTFRALFALVKRLTAYRAPWLVVLLAILFALRKYRGARRLR